MPYYANTMINCMYTACTPAIVMQTISIKINQSIFECIMPYSTRAQAGPKQHYINIYNILYTNIYIKLFR